MSTLQKIDREKIIECYAIILESERAVTFEVHDTIIRIWDSVENGGWYITVYSENDNGDFEEIDGGLCTGGVYEAIQFIGGL